MKNLKKMLASLVVVAMMASMAIVPAFAATLSYEKQAEQLNKVGLYMGIDPDKFVPDLETLLDRQTGVVMLLRMFGQEEEAKLLSDEQANSMLAKFTDAGTIADWAKKQVAYAVDKGVVKGYAEDSTFRPAAGLNGKAYCSLLLQQLGYNGDFDYHQAATKLSQVGGLNASQAAMFNSDTQINKDSLVGISFGTLQAKYKADGKKLIKALIESKYVSEEKAKEAEIAYADITSVAAIADVTVDIGATPTLPATVTATYDNGTTADVAVTWPTVDTSAAGEKTVTGTIANTAVTASVKVIVVPAELKVEGKASGNLMELVLNFNRPVAKEDEAKDKANYKVKKFTVDNAELSEDKMTVTLLLTSKMSQQSEVVVTVDKDLGFDDDVELTIKGVKDTTPPEVVSVEAVGNGLLKVKFSEPVQNYNAISNFTIDGKLFGSSQPTLSSNDKTVSFKLTKRLTAGEHKFVVKNKIADYAGFSVEDNETAFVVAEDTTAPTGAQESATQTKVVIKFSEPVEKPKDSAVKTNTSAKIEKIELADDDVTMTITFEVEDALPTAGGKITIDDLSDYSGNKVDFEISVTPTYDVERPEFVGYKVDGKQTKIILEFSEDVYNKAEYTEFTLTDKDDKDVALGVIAYDLDDDKKDVKNKLVLVRADGSAFKSEKHTLKIEKVTDLNPLKNTIIKTSVTIDIDDQQVPTVTKVFISSNDLPTDIRKANDFGTNKPNAIYVEFSEEVDEATATDLDSYSYVLGGITSELDKNLVDVDLLSDGKTVRLDFVTDDKDSIDVDKIERLQINSVTDLAGNKMSTKSVPNGEFESTASNAAPTVTKVAVTDKNTIVLSITGSINDKTLNPGDFVITAGDETITAWDAEYKSSDKQIKLTVNNDIDANAKYEGATIYFELADDVETVNAFEQELKSAKLPVQDEYAPTAADSVASAVYSSGSTVAVIEISEELDLTDAAAISNADLAQFRVKADGKTVNAVIKYYAAEAKDDSATEDVNEAKARFEVIITGNYSGKNVQVVFMASADVTIMDKSTKGNALKDFDLTKKVK